MIRHVMEGLFIRRLLIRLLNKHYKYIDRGGVELISVYSLIKGNYILVRYGYHSVSLPVTTNTLKYRSRIKLYSDIVKQMVFLNDELTIHDILYKSDLNIKVVNILITMMYLTKNWRNNRDFSFTKSKSLSEKDSETKFNDRRS